MTPEELEARSGIQWTDYQLEAFTLAQGQEAASGRLCLFFKTGAGKTYTALGCVALWGADEILVVAPPSTHSSWEAAGDRLGVQLRCISHAKFRMAGTKLSRTQAVVVDEFHMLGGHNGKGWKKMDTLARHLKAPLIIASATPNYNDAERVYCIHHVLDPHAVKGGYLQFLYTHCITEANPFAQEPKVTGFRHYKSATEYLVALPMVAYVEDDLVYDIVDLPIQARVPAELEEWGYLERKHRMIASQIEERHARVDLALIDSDGKIYEDVYDVLADLAGQATTPVLVFANHSTVADALGRSLSEAGVDHAVLTGKHTKKVKDEALQKFREGKLDILVGTSTLATGTDGLDKVCNTMIILDDTDDASLRRQLIGRIMPRGVGDLDASMKQVFRLVA